MVLSYSTGIELLVVLWLGDGLLPRPNAIPEGWVLVSCLLRGGVCCIDPDVSSYAGSLEAAEKDRREPHAGRKEKRREDLFSALLSLFLRLKPNDVRRDSVEGRPIASKLSFGIAFFMLTGGCARDDFSGLSGRLPSCD